ncbi:hypothetical protein HZI73_10030 [Vallitalea pronyensis]|uniref:SCP domain-containing protein n=2 Tax=Vallitalea pronyensis TaxID=1348613 RepID=A0A8J8SJK3_9FIRM|nr:hypothetical protein HZI73_10030 [Vallitalea pronyensis]
MNAPQGTPNVNMPGGGKTPQLPGNIMRTPGANGAPTTPGSTATTPGRDTTPAPNNAATPNTTAPNDNATANGNQNTTTNQSISSGEQQMINLVNQSRKQNGLPALQADNELSEIARIKSKDMIDKNYFSHNSPTYGSPFDMLKNFGVSYIKAGENIAGNQTVDKAHEALMNSPGHRQNILSSEYTHIGVGIQKGGQYGNMFTQIFIRK